MKLPSPLIPGQFLRRYKRFLTDIELKNGETITAHLADPGKLPGFREPGSKVWLSYSNDPKRKLKYRLELWETPDGRLVGLNTQNANKIAYEALLNNNVTDLGPISNLKREVKADDHSRLDFAYTDQNDKLAYLEVKNVTWLRSLGETAFPDTKTTRGAKHLRLLTALQEQGTPACLLFIIQRDDARRLSIASDIDLEYAKAFEQARESGVTILAHLCKINHNEILLDKKIFIV